MSELISPMLKNFYFSALENKTMAEMEKVKMNYGRVTEMIFLISEKERFQQLRFSKKTYNKKTDQLDLSVEEVKEFTDKIGWDYDEEIKKYKNIFITMDFKKQIIFIRKNNHDGTFIDTEL